MTKSELSTPLALVLAVAAVAIIVVAAVLFVPSFTASTTKPSGGPYPVKRWGTEMVYDPLDHYVVMFSGSNGANDTWTFSDGKWSLLPEAIAPVARVYPCMVWDAGDGYILLFGGTESGAGAGRLLNDTWEFKNGVWTELHPSVAPPPLYLSGCAYDAGAGYVVMFGGHGNGTGNDSTDGTWIYSGGDWKLLSPSTVPLSRYGAAVFYDAASQEVVMYGGWTDEKDTAEADGLCVPWMCPYLSDTWVFKGGQWTQDLAGSSPPGHLFDSATYDSSIGHGIVFGGQQSRYKVANSTQTATWTYDGSEWVNVTPSNSPGPEFGGGMAYDAASDFVVLFGGLSGTMVDAATNNYTWMYSYGEWTNITSTSA